MATDPDPLVRALRPLGLRPGHRIGSALGNTPAAVLLARAARQEGWTVVPLGARDPPGVRRGLFHEAGVHAVLDLDGDGSGLPGATLGKLGAVAAVRGRVDGEPASDGAAVLLRTSGTTGAPRWVGLTWAMLDAHAEAATRRLQDGHGSVWLAVLGLHRVGGVALLHRALQNGSTVLLEERFDAARCARHLQDRGVTHVSLVPAMLHRLLAAWGNAAPPPHLRCVLLGGDHAPEGLVQDAIAKGWPVWCTYGLTEASSQVATASPQERRARPGTSGRPLDGVEVRIVDGEVHVAGPTVSGGHVATGDLGHLDGDGHLFVTGRKGDLIVTGGVKVDPVAVEEALRSHPAVADACVVGMPDPELGQRVVAAVVPRGGEAPDLAALSAWCKGRVPSGWAPRDLRTVGSLPRTEEGKLRRAEVRAQLQATVPT